MAMNNRAIVAFVVFGIAVFFLIVTFWAAFGEDSCLTDTSQNWGAGALWRAFYALLGMGILLSLIVEGRRLSQGKSTYTGDQYNKAKSASLSNGGFVSY